MAQKIECLPREIEALSSNSGTVKKEKKKGLE
jgi:hypothetical protein